MKSIEQTFAVYFKPEIQKRGREDYNKGLAFISNSSDTQVQGFVKSMPPLKVSFYSKAIANDTFTASCTCSSASKGSYCKHMWAMILATQDKRPDFLEAKTNVELGEVEAKKERPQTTAYKEKQAEFKKRQYEKQKLWTQKIRLEKKIKEAPPKPSRQTYSDSIEQALDFFTKNGFAMQDIPSADQLKAAKKQLARLFHPDKGGLHEEAVLLNKHYDALIRFIER